MSDTTIDFGGFTVDVSKIEGVKDAVASPDTFVNFGDYGPAFWVSGIVAKQIRTAYASHEGRHAKPDGWYWVSQHGSSRKLIRFTGGRIDATWGELAFRPKVSQSLWTDYQPADPLSAEFLYALTNDGSHPSDRS